MNNLADKIRGSSTIKEADIITKSKVYNTKDMIDTEIPGLNIALSGDIDGGLAPGVLVLAGPSKHFKSAFALIMAAAYQRKYPESVILFYDSEFGVPESYFKSWGVDMERVVHTPITDIEELKHDLMIQLKNITRGEKVIIIIDSIGNLASKKEIDDAIDGKSVADMTRAKAFKSFFRMITPRLTLKDIPMIAINHTYQEMGLYPKEIVSGGRGVTLAADNVWILGRQQEKDGKEISGYNFIINVEKSRYVKEKSKIPITVTYDAGIMKWSGLFNIALEGGYINKASVGYYTSINTGEDKFRESDLTNNEEFWKDILEKTNFKEYVKNKYMVDGRSISIDEEEEV